MIWLFYFAVDYAIYTFSLNNSSLLNILLLVFRSKERPCNPLRVSYLKSIKYANAHYWLIPLLFNQQTIPYLIKEAL